MDKKTVIIDAASAVHSYYRAISGVGDDMPGEMFESGGHTFYRPKN